MDIVSYIPPGLIKLWTIVMKGFGTVCLVGVLATVCGVYFFQAELIYPSRLPVGSRTAVMKPHEYDMEIYEEIYLTTPDKVKLHCYLIKHENKDAPTILFLHANAGNMGHRLPIARILYQLLGCNIFMLSYRGYGLSEGKPQETGLRQDAETALRYLVQRPDINPLKIVVYGQSIGGAVAIHLAADHPNTVKLVILENTFSSLRKLIPRVMPYLRPFAFLCKDKWESDRAIVHITSPILFLSGTEDELVPPKMMAELFELSISKKKKLVPFKKGTHNDTCLQPGYFEAIVAFWMETIDANVRNRNADIDEIEKDQQDQRKSTTDEDEDSVMIMMKEHEELLTRRRDRTFVVDE